MLSVVPIKQSSVSSNYYLKQDGGYYIEDGKNEELYQWFGKGAHDLGLNGAINNAEHGKVYLGRLPNGAIVGKPMPDGSIKGRPGYDLTFSMNKDISLIICASNDKNLSDYFLKAHINAVKTTLTEVEKRIEARTTLDGYTGFETTKNMIASLCTHFSSRAGDADVHTHALIANATKRSDGKWRALATDMSRKNGFFEMIRDNAVYFGSLYQNEMACATKNVGFGIEHIHKNGMFKITGFPDDLRDHFSKRRKQIKDIVATLNPAIQQDKKIYDKVAQHSKASKETIDQKSFYEKTKHDVQNYLEKSEGSKNFDDIIRGCIEKGKMLGTLKSHPDIIAQTAIQDAIVEQSKFNVHFDKNKVLQRATTLYFGEVNNHDLQNAFSHIVKSGDLILLKNNEYTTAALIAREKNMIKSVENAATNHSEIIIDDKKNSFSDILGKSRFCIITEPNSIKDKNKCLTDLISTLENADKKVKVLTLDKGINQDLKNMQSSNILDLLKNIAKTDIAINIHAFVKQHEAEISIPLNNIFSKDGKEVFIVDDAKRLDFDTVQKLIDLSGKRKANIIFLKNHNGRHSLLSGNPLELIEKCKINKLDARQLYSDSKNNGANKNKLPNQITISEAPNSDKIQSVFLKQTSRHKALASLFVSQTNDQIENTIAVSHSKKSTELLNSVIREELKNTGKIGHQQYMIKMLSPVFLGDSEKKQAKFYPENVLLKTYLGRGIFRTQKILGHDPSQNKVILQSEFGRRSLVDPNKITKDTSRNIATIYEEKSIALAEGDRIVVAHENRLSKQLNLKSNQSYKISEINEKYVTLEGGSTNEKIKTKLSNLNNLSLNHHYAISVHGSLSSLKNKEQVFCDLPSYTVNANALSDIGRHTDKIHIVTDDAEVAKQRIDKFIFKKIVMDNTEKPPEDIKHTELKSIDNVIKKGDYKIMELE